jgi:hypothetical protein
MSVIVATGISRRLSDSWREAVSDIVATDISRRLSDCCRYAAPFRTAKR